LRKIENKDKRKEHKANRLSPENNRSLITCCWAFTGEHLVPSAERKHAGTANATGSTESRAAARMLAESKNKPKRVIRILFVDHHHDDREPRLLRRQEGADFIWDMWGYSSDGNV
jgi:hypothetical protein